MQLFIDSAIKASSIFGRKTQTSPYQKTRQVLIVVIIAAFLTSCATFEKKPPAKRLPPLGQKPTPATPLPTKPEPMHEAPRMNARPSTQDIVTPQRQVSLRLVERGKTLLDSKELDKASAVFMDAINLDTSNGIAYYYLAVTDERLGLPQMASGLLDKAEALLGADEEWQRQINELRTVLGEPISRPFGPSPVDQEF